MKNAIAILAHFDDLTIFGGGFLREIDYGLIAASPARIWHLNVASGLEPPQYSIWGVTSDFSWQDYYLKPDKRLVSYNEESIETDILRFSKNIVETGVQTIYTHNPGGEYGHAHHRWVSEAVCKAAIRHRLTVWAPASVVYIDGSERWHFDACGLPSKEIVYPRPVFNWRMKARHSPGHHGNQSQNSLRRPNRINRRGSSPGHLLSPPQDHHP